MSGNNLSRYTAAEWESIKAARGDRALHCSFSPRFIKVAGVHPDHTGNGHTVVLQVMTDRSPDKPNRMLCEPYVTLEQLREVMAEMEDDRAWLQKHGA